MEEALSSTSIAARVAERYARLPSWRDMLAAQATAKSTVDSLVAAASAPFRCRALSAPHPSRSLRICTRRRAEPRTVSARSPSLFRQHRFAARAPLHASPGARRIPDPLCIRGAPLPTYRSPRRSSCRARPPAARQRHHHSPRARRSPQGAPPPRRRPPPRRSGISTLHPVPETPSVVEEQHLVTNSPGRRRGAPVSPRRT